MDLNKIRAKLKELEDKKKPSSFKRIWKPEEGSTQIRLVPNPKNREYSIMELGFYYDIAPRSIISPENFGDPDPIAELSRQLMSTGDREDWRLGAKLQAKTRYYTPIIIRGREEEGVFLWGFSKTVWEELLRTMDDPDYGDITDLKTGTDITVEYIKPEKKGEYPKTAFRVKRKSTPVTDDPDIMKLIEDVPQPDEIWNVPTYDELSEILDNFINNRSNDDVDTDNQSNDDSDADTDPQSSLHDVENNSDHLTDFNPPSVKSSERKKPIKDAADNVDDAFDALFNS